MSAADVVVDTLEQKYNRILALSASNLCTHCGWCIDACHVYQGLGDPATTPVAKAEKIRRVYKTRHDWLSRIFPFWTGARPLSDEDLDDWVEVAFRYCTLCERCLVNCPMGVETPQLLGAARAALTAAGRAPEMLVMLADAAIAREENLEFTREFYVEQITMLEEEVRDFLGDPGARIPLEEPARVLYVPLSGAHTVVPPAIIFNLVGESWTLSMFEASNYGVFLGDLTRAKRIAQRIIDEAARIGAEDVILPECGHAYSALRWEAPKWFGGPLPFRVRSLLEVLDEYVAAGRLPLDPTRNPEPITYHDSCNLGRKGGIFEEPRRVIRAAAVDFREMTPNREQSLCCGGGSGLVAIPEWEDTRLAAGRPKAEQVRRCGAEYVIASCDNCRIQLGDLTEHYGLGVQVMGLAELVVRALDTGRSGR